MKFQGRSQTKIMTEAISIKKKKKWLRQCPYLILFLGDLGVYDDYKQQKRKTIWRRQVHRLTYYYCSFDDKSFVNMHKNL